MSSKPASPQSTEITTDNPVLANETEDPRWLAVRETVSRLKEIGRSFLEGQAWLGWQLACLKKDHGCTHGGARRGSSRQIGDLKSWPEIVREKTGLSDRTADRQIQLFEATKAKLKRSKEPEKKAALAIFSKGNPLALPADQRDHLRDVIASLCLGETQASLMEELGVLPKPAKLKKGKDADDEEELTQMELAFHHWDGTASAIVKARSPEGVKLLHLLPDTTDEPGKLSLVFLRDEAAALLSEVEQVLATHAKPAKSTRQ